MPSVRLTLVSNIQQNKQTVSLFPSSPVPAETLFKVAKQKLGLKKPARVFAESGIELTPGDPAGSIDVENGMTLLISSNVDFIGASKPAPSAAHRSTGEVSLIANESHVDPEAVAQLKYSATLPGMRLVVGMPDLHAGSRKHPVGAAFISRGRIFPALVGGDIGCGMLLLKTRIDANCNVDRLAVKLRGIGVPEGLEGEWTHGHEPWRRHALASQDAAGSPTSRMRPDFDQFDTHLGTIGGGNHFAEITCIDKVYDEATFSRLNLDVNRLLLLVHSGSRGLGTVILDDTEQHLAADGSLEEGAPEAVLYRSRHDHAIRWARSNRLLIAHRVLSLLGERNHTDGPEGMVEERQILDICHNRVDRLTPTEVEILGLNVSRPDADDEIQRGEYWIHRKGAAPSTEGLVVIPGSRAALSYVVLPINTGRQHALSLAHGAGRLLSRHKAHATLSRKYAEESKISTFLERTAFGGRVICEDRSLLYEEAPEAYKDEGQVIRDLEAIGAIKVVMTLRPVVSYKCARQQ